MGQPMSSYVFCKVILEVMLHFLGGKENSLVHAHGAHLITTVRHTLGSK